MQTPNLTQQQILNPILNIPMNLPSHGIVGYNFTPTMMSTTMALPIIKQDPNDLDSKVRLASV